MYIDPRLIELRQGDPERTIEVMVVYKTPSDSLHARLEEAGMTDLEHSAPGTFFSGKIKAAHLARLEAIAELDAVHSDEPVQALPKYPRATNP